MIRTWLAAVLCVCVLCLVLDISGLQAKEDETVTDSASAEAKGTEAPKDSPGVEAKDDKAPKDAPSDKAKKVKAPKLPDPEKVLKKLVKKADLSGTLKSALKKCQKLCGAAMRVDWAGLRAAGVKPDKQVVVKAPSATVEQLLEMTLIRAAVKGRPLGWYIDGKTICVTTQRRVLAWRLGVARELGAFRRPRGAGAKRARPRNVIRRIHFNENKLADVVDFLRTISGVNFFVDWRALKLVDIDRDTLVTLKVSNVTIARTLDLLTDTISTSTDKFDRVYWVIDGGMVRISTGSGLDTKTKVRVFDVADLLMAMPKFKGFNFKTDSSSDSDKDDDDDDDNDDEDTLAERRKRQEEKLIAIIKQTIGEDMWQPQGKGTIRIIHDKLVISQTLLGFKLISQATRR